MSPRHRADRHIRQREPEFQTRHPVDAGFTFRDLGELPQVMRALRGLFPGLLVRQRVETIHEHVITASADSGFQHRNAEVTWVVRHSRDDLADPVLVILLASRLHAPGNADRDRTLLHACHRQDRLRWHQAAFGKAKRTTRVQPSGWPACVARWSYPLCRDARRSDPQGPCRQRNGAALHARREPPSLANALPSSSPQ